MSSSKILLVDDDPTVISSLNALLSGLGQLRFATSGRDALQLALRWQPDLVLLDIEMAGMSGFEVCSALKANPVLQDVPVIFLTAHDSLEQELRGLNLGAVDFVTKPPRGPVVTARVRSQLKLRELMERLRVEATTDPLTGVANRRRFDEAATREWLRAQRTGSATAVLLADVDYFKAYNDGYGHQAGDRVLQDVASELASAVHRPGDLVARYGGEEFAVLLPETDAPGALTVARSLCERIEMLLIPHTGSKVSSHLTISVGAAAYDSSSPHWVGPARSFHADSGRPRPPFSALMESADRALYKAKSEGRRRAVVGPLEMAAARKSVLTEERG